MQSRFNIPTIFEFYGATESNVAFFNFATKPEHRGYVPVLRCASAMGITNPERFSYLSCIGRWTLLHRLLKTIEIVKVDEVGVFTLVVEGVS